jgi:ABC-type multidrug transport system ATPase subunit
MSISDQDFIDMFEKDKEIVDKEIGEILTLLQIFVPEFRKLDENLTKKDYIYFSLMISKIKHAYANFNEAISLFALIEGKEKKAY